MNTPIALLIAASMATAADWPAYRGPNGTGVSPETGLPSEIGPDRNVIWKVKIQKGNSSPVVVGNRIFLTAEEGEDRVTLCLDAARGTEIWRATVKRARNDSPHPLNGAATPSVATDGRNAFVFFPEVGLLAYDEKGREKWRVPMGPFGAVQGMAVSPVYAEGKVMLAVDTPEMAYLQAFDAASGKQVWRAERPIGVLGSYSTPSLYRPAKGPLQIIVAGTGEVTGYQVGTGERLWWVRDITAGPAALPLVAGDAVYTMEPAGAAGPSYAQLIGPYDKNKDNKIDIAAEVSGERVQEKIMYRLFKSVDKHNGDGDGVMIESEFNKAFNPDAPAGGLVRTKLGGKGDVTATHVEWKHKKGLPYVTAPLLYENVLYVVRDGGILTVLEPTTGKVLREDRVKEAIGQYYASPVAADGKIYLIAKDGKSVVLEAGKDWKVTSFADFAEDTIATPAISGGRLFLRTAATLYCFGKI